MASIVSLASVVAVVGPGQPAAAAPPVFTGAGSRLIDTRQSTRSRPAGALRHGQVLTVNVGTSKSVALNVTAVAPTGRGYFTTYPCGQSRPTASMLNFPTSTIANFTIATPNSNGDVCVYASVNSGGSVHIIVDKFGELNGAPFSGQTPARKLDTRLRGGKVAANQFRNISGLPPHAAVALNLTVTQPEGGGWFAAYPCADGYQGASNLNYTRDETRAAFAIARADVNGQVCIRTSTRAHMIVDQMGTFASDPAVDIINPARVVDTRKNFGARYGREFSINVSQISSERGDIYKSRGRAVILNIAAVSPAGNGYLTVWPCSSPRPTTSLVNYSTNRYATSNAVIVQPDSSGRVCVWSPSSVHLLVDLAGFVNTSARSSMINYEPRTDCIRGSMAFANAERRRVGVAPVIWSEDEFKTACAQMHRIAYDNDMRHWLWDNQTAADILAGGAPAVVEPLWLASPPHRAVIVDPVYTKAAFAYLPPDGANSQSWWGTGHFRYPNR